MSLYDKRIALHGNTVRERHVDLLKRQLLREAPESLSYKNVKLNGVDTNMIINSGTQPYYKRFRSMPNQAILMGDYVEWENETWLVYTADVDDEVFIDGMLYQCNYNLKWQDKTGKILERKCFVMNASAYNNGEDGNRTLFINTNQMMIYLPYDEDTITLTDNRVYCDYGSNQKPYKITRNDRVTYKWGDKGLVNLLLTESQDRAGDRPDLGLCDYIQTASDVVTPVAAHSEIYAPSLNLINGDLPVQYTVKFFDSTGTEIADMVAVWTVVADVEVDKSITGNSISLSVYDDTAIGKTIKLGIANSGYESSITLNVISQF